MSVAVVIRCRNEEAHIGRLLTGILRQTRRPDEIIVVDSGSTDATLAIASAFPVTTVHIAPEDFSFGRACNIGVAACESDTAIFVSAHCYPIYDTWIEEMIAPFQSADVALSYGRQTGPPGGSFSEQQLFERWFPNSSTARQQHPFCNNANAAIRTAVWASIPYNEHLTGLEDLDWAKRALEAGHVLSYVAAAPVVHVHQQSFSQVLNRYRREAIAHKQIYDDQRMSALEAGRLAVANIAADWLAARRLRRDLRTYLSVGKFRVAQFAGTYRGFAQQGPVTALLKRRFYYPDTDTTLTSGIAARPATIIDYNQPTEPSEFH